MTITAGPTTEHEPAARLLLLGTPRLVLSDRPSLALERRLAALLAMLALDGPTPRARVAELLWPGADDPGARNNLRQRLFRLRQAAGIDLVLSKPLLELGTGIAHDLSDLATRLRIDPAAGQGDLLGNLRFDDCLGLAEWVAGARERWAQARRHALAEVGSALETDGHLALALQHAERLVGEAPWLEHAHRRLMRLHYLRGDRAAALAAFDRCRDLLQQEQGGAPGPETLELARLIEAGHSLGGGKARPAPVAILRPPRLVGRDAEWKALESARQQQCIAVVRGEPGIGKSRLVHDFAAEQDGAVLVAARPGDANMPYALAARLLLELAQRLGTPPQAWIVAELARLVPGWGQAAAGPLEPVCLLQALAAALSHWQGRSLSALVFDDLQLADAASLELLVGLLASDESRGLHWLVCLQAAEVPPVWRAWQAKAPPDATLEVTLGTLDQAAVAELLASLAIPGFDAAGWAAPLTRHTGGNPMFVLETLRALLAQGALKLPASGARLPAPVNLGALIERRLNQLSAAALQLARVAALAGPDFSAECAAAVLGLHPLDLAEPWRELEAAQVLRDGGLANDLIVEATLHALPQPISQALHRRIAAVLQASDAPPAAIARHLREAAAWGPAGAAFVAAAQASRRSSRRADEVDCWLAGADCLDRAGDTDAAFDARCNSVEAMVLVQGVARASELTAQLLRVARNPAQRYEALTRHAMARLMAADHPAGVAAAQEALALAGPPGATWPRFEAARLLAVGLAQGGRAADAVPLIEPFRDFVESEGSTVQRGRFWADYAYVLNSARRLRDTATALQQAIDQARGSGDLAEQATLTSNLALVSVNLGNAGAALESMLQSRALHAQLGGTSGPAGGAIDMYVGMLYGQLGRYQEALDSLDVALDCFVRDGQTVWIAGASNHKAQFLLELGQVTRALQALQYDEPSIDSVRSRRAMLAGRIERALGRSGESESRAALAHLTDDADIHMRMVAQLDLAALLPPPQAVALCRAVLRNAERAEYLGVAAKARCLLAQQLLRDGRALAAARLLRQRVPQADRVTPADLCASELHWIRYQVFDAVGDVAAAHDALQRGVDWIRLATLKNVPEAFRDSFLNRNPVHRALLTTARHQQGAA
jgi:DNA-binding SARP family transcriptional activator